MANHVNINSLYVIVNAEYNINKYLSDSWWIITQDVVSINCKAKLHSRIFITNSRNVLEGFSSSFSSTALKRKVDSEANVSSE